MSKRIDSARGAATSVDGDELRELLTPAAASGIATADALRPWFARRTDTRFPRHHLLERDPETLPDMDCLLALADDAARGEWRVFGQPLNDGASAKWTSHPVSGTPTPSEHWRSISYMNGIGGADVKYIWELNRHQPLVRIAQGYFITRRPELAERVVSLVDEWVQANPPGRGINWTSSLEIAFRSIAWCWIWALTCDSPAWSDERLSRFLVSLWHHARHIDRYDSTHHSPNTHLTGELLALFYIGVSFPEFARSKRWAQRGRAVLTSELERQVLDDGMHFERSVGYHRYTAEFYLHFLLLARSAGEPITPDNASRVRDLVAASWLTRRPDGTWPVIGDEDSGSTLLVGTGDAQSQSTILAVGAALFGERSWIPGADVAGRSGAWWLLDTDLWTSLGEMPRASSALSGSLPAAGYYMGREADAASGWFCLVDAGPHGGEGTGHAHTDLGHVEIAHGNVHVVSDPGCASYTTNTARRDWCRSEAAHACVVIDGAPLAIPAGPFSWQRVSPTPAVQTGDDGTAWWCELSYRRPGRVGTVTHRRQVVLVRGCGVLIADWIDAATPLSFALHWPLAVDQGVLDGARVRAKGVSMLWAMTGGTSGDAVLEGVQSSPGYGREQDALLVRVPVRCEGHASIVTGFTEDEVALSASEHPDGTILCEVVGTVRRTVVLQPGRAPRVTTTDARG